MAKRTQRGGGDPPPESSEPGRGAGNSPTAIRRRSRTWPATVTLHLREGMEPVSGMPNVGTLPSLNPPAHDEQGRLLLPFATGTERLQARVVMHHLCSHYLATLDAPAVSATLEPARELAERMTEEIRESVKRLRQTPDGQALERMAPEWLHTLDSRWKVARTTEADTPYKLAEWSWASVYGDLTALDLVESVADRLGAEMAERATALVTLLVDEPLRAAVLADPDLVARWPWAAGRLLVGGDTRLLAETTWPGVDAGATFEEWRDLRMARAILRAGERMTESPWRHTGWPGKAAPDDVAEWLEGKGRRPPSLRFEGVEWRRIMSPWAGSADKLRRHSWASQFRHVFTRRQSKWPQDLCGNPLDLGDGLRPVERLWLAARVLAGGVPAHEFDARDNSQLVLEAKHFGLKTRQAQSIAEANYVEDALRHNRTWPPNLSAEQVRHLERATDLLRRQHLEKREPSPQEGQVIVEARAILDAGWRAEDQRLEGLRRLEVGGQAPDPEWAGLLDLEVGGVDPRNDYKYTSRSWALHVSELPYQALALVHVLEARANVLAPRKRRRSALPEAAPQPTYEEAKRFGMAYADGPAGHRWEPISGEVALRHVVLGHSLETKLKAGDSLDWWGAPATVEALQKELAGTGLDSLFALYEVLNLAATTPGHAVVAIDDLSKATWGRIRGPADRNAKRRTIYRWLCLFENTSIIGDRTRGKYKDPLTKKLLDTVSVDPLFRLGRKVYEVNNQREFDASEPPLEVTIIPGQWIDKFRGNHGILSDFGNLRQLAEIAPGKPSGDWARSIGLALNQQWRELASYAQVAHRGDENTQTVRFPHPFTRRKLLGMFRPNHSVEAVLGGDDPGRARKYWDEAIKKLRSVGIVGHYKPLGPPLKARKDWQDDWLDEPLDIRPKESGMKAVAGIANAAKKSRKKARKPTSTGGK